MHKNSPLLVTGATGYIGGRLVARLLEAGYRVRAVSRSMGKLKTRPWATHPNVELFKADLLEPADCVNAVQGCETIYYLVHSMLPGSADFEKADRMAATHLVQAAEQHHLKRIIYLGGLGLDNDQLSPHLQSRREVEVILRTGSVPVTTLRAAMIIGSGSASFEILRYLVDRLPVMLTPRWVSTPCQPIAIDNVLEYLIGCLKESRTIGQTFDIGGPDIRSYAELMQIYAQEAGLLKRICIPIPLLTPRLSSLWIHHVTPVPKSLARPLAEGLRNPVVCHDTRIQNLIPQDLLTCQQAIRRATDRLNEHCVETHWSDSGRIPVAAWSEPNDPTWAGGTLYRDQRSLEIQATPEEVWKCGAHWWSNRMVLWELDVAIAGDAGSIGRRRGATSRTATS